MQLVSFMRFLAKLDLLRVIENLSVLLVTYRLVYVRFG